MTDIIHEKGYDGPTTSSLDIVIIVLEEGHGYGEMILPSAFVTGWMHQEEKAVGALTLPMPYVLGASGYQSSGAGALTLPGVSVSGTMTSQELYTLPKVTINGWFGAHSNVDNGLAIDLQTGYNLPQVSIEGTMHTDYMYGDLELPQIRINIKDTDLDGVEDDVVWVDTDGDGEPDTAFIDPAYVDTDGDGVPDTWVETWYQGTTPVVGKGKFVLPQVQMSGQSGMVATYIVPKVTITGTMEAEQIMEIGIDVPVPEVSGSITTENYFRGGIDVPAPVVSGSISSQVHYSGEINVPLPRVMASATITPPNDYEAVINVPKPVVRGRILSTVTSDTDLSYGGTPQCTP